MPGLRLWVNRRMGIDGVAELEELEKSIEEE